MLKRKKTKRNRKQSLWNQIRWGESYTSFILGLVVIIVSFVLVISFVKNKNTKVDTGRGQTSSISTKETPQENTVNNSQAVYTIKTGDTLWSIAENFYNSGYNWVDIARANNLENPRLIHAGNKLAIPNTKRIVAGSPIVKQPQIETKENTSITENSYTVVKGDNLWNIAVKAYGDGFRWVDIAKANNLQNPSLVFSDNVLKIPR